MGAPPAFRWSRPVSFAEPTYNLTIATDPGLTNIVLQQTGLTQQQFALLAGVLAGRTRYFWSVTATNQSGSTASTPAVASFVTAGHCAGDADNSGEVTFSDITSVLTNFNMVCP